MRKKFMFSVSALALLSMGLTVLASCGGEKELDDVTTGGLLAPHFDLYVDAQADAGAELDRTRLSSGGEALVTTGQKDVTVHAFEAPVGSTVTFTVTNSDGSEEEGFSIDADGKMTVPQVSKREDFTLTATATKDDKAIKKSLALTVIPDSLLAQDETLDWTSKSNDELETISGKLEEYLLEHGGLGMPTYKGSGYNKVSSRLRSELTEDKKVTNDAYVTGFGLGTFEYLWVAEDSPTETNSSWKRYYHTENGLLYDNVNPYLATGNVTTEYYRYINAQYYALLLNNKKSTEFVPSLARELPHPIDAEGKELDVHAPGSFNKYKVYLNTDKAGTPVTYNYNGKAGTVASKYGGTKATLEDYLTPYLLRFTQWTQATNVSQMMGQANSIKGLGEYYAATATKPSDGKIDVDQFLDMVGITLNEEEGSITFEFEGSFTTDFAAYYISNDAPVPLSMIEEMGNGDVAEGLKVFGFRNTATNTGVIDNVLSTGPYMLEEFSTDNRIVYKKNPNWHVKKDSAGRDVYKLEGYVDTFNSALKDDTSGELSYQEYLAGNQDTSGVPSSVRDAEKNKPDTIYIADSGSSNNLAFNTLSQLDWLYLHDEKTGVGSAYNDPSQYSGRFAKNEYPDREPIMSNRNFQKGLVTGLNRQTWIDSTLGSGAPATSYFSTAQKMSPAASESYNDTEAHKAAVKNVFGTDGISPTSNAAGIRYMRSAIKEELDAGHYVLGTADKPTEVTLDAVHYHISWTEAYQPIYTALEQTFAQAVKSVAEWNTGDKPLITLKINAITTEDADSMYMPWCNGTYGDISCGQITGGTYDVYGLFYLFESRNHAANLNLWPSVLTEVPSARIEVDGKYYSFDAAAFAGITTVELGGNGEYANRY